MCRLFALTANRPTRVAGSLLDGPHSLWRQSGCDRRGLCHDSGWGIGFYPPDVPNLVRSAQPAQHDPHYRSLANSILAHTVLAHVRLASAGAVEERNAHPFLRGRWLFAHNGTLFGFAADPERLRGRIPPHLRRQIQGDTDSEHAFYLLLAGLEQRLGSLDGPAEAGIVGDVLGETIHTLHELFPGADDDLSQLNFVLTDGRILVASRWRHSLFWLERRKAATIEGDAPAEMTAAYHAIAVASEPTTSEDWSELPDRTILRIESDLSSTITALGGGP